VLRFLFWRLLGLAGLFIGFAAIAWLLRGGAGRALRGGNGARRGLTALGEVPDAAWRGVVAVCDWTPLGGNALVKYGVALSFLVALLLCGPRSLARRRRSYVRLRVEPYRTDRASTEAIVAMYAVLHKRLLARWWRRLMRGQPSIALEVHHTPTPHLVWLAIACPSGMQQMVETALQSAYPNCSVRPEPMPLGDPPALLRLKKRSEFIKRVKAVDPRNRDPEPSINRVMTVMGASGEPAFVQLAMTPTPAAFEWFAKHLFKRHEAHLSRQRREHLIMRDRSFVEDAELRGGLDVQHRPLFFVDLRVVAPTRRVCEQIASELRAEGAENHLIERGTSVRQGAFGLYARRVQRGEGNAIPSFHKGVFATTELAAIWHLPSSEYATVPFARSALPVAPAAPAIFRPPTGLGTLTDALGPVSIHAELRKQNTAVPGAVEQGKSSYLVATVAEDLRRPRCAVIVLDPKGDAAEAAVSLVPADRRCTLLDFSHPTCGFNPLAVNAPADVIADYVVGALKNLFTDADIRASSDRYLRNAIIAVLAHDRHSTLWDAARLLSVGEEGYSYRTSVGSRVRTMPQFKEIADFFTAELTAQLADSRSTTTAKLDAPVNKLARLLNSPSIKRVLLNDSLAVDFDRVIAEEEVLVVKGALGAMGAGNTSVLMQLLVGMLDAALARQQDLVPADRRVAVALKVDEAPLVLNRGFAETMALKRSAGLETVAAWQTDAQWTDRSIRDQLDALFAHRVYFATASARDARTAVELTMSEFSDTIRPGIEHLSALARPDVRLHLPKHHAIVSWTTPEGRQPPFLAQTIPLCVDAERLALHGARQHELGGRHRSDLRQPHWDSPRTPADVNEGPALPDQPAHHARRAAVSETGPVAELTPVAESRSAQESAGARHHVLGSDVAARASAPALEPDHDSILAGLPVTPAESFRELVDLDAAHSVRWAKAVESPVELQLDDLDLAVLLLIASLGHVLTTQIHRRFNAGRAVTTTQRRLKRLADAGTVGRFQFHRRDGGGAPMCYVITALGLELLYRRDRMSRPAEPVTVAGGGLPGRTPPGADRGLRQARHEVHAAGWALALERALGGVREIPRGAGAAVISPPMRSIEDGRVALKLADLRLPGGRTPHDFLRTDGEGRRVAVERFETVRPDVVVEVSGYSQAADSRASPRARVSADSVTQPGSSVDVLAELDDRLSSGGWLAKLERYDHFLSGWSAHTNRYGRRRDAVPVVVFVCRDRARARDCARTADSALRACRAYAGEYPFDWQYPGRERILFVAERDVHEGLTGAYGVPTLPPEVRVSAARGDPRAGAAAVEQRSILHMPAPE
jgi:hypothetical protein